MVQRIVYNACFGGFGLQENAVKWVRDNKTELVEQYDSEDVTEIADSTLSGETFPDGSGPKNITHISSREVSRDNELLADIVSEQTSYDGRYDGPHASLQVAEVPDGVSWTIDKHDGSETVREASETFS
jgi:hypothetical protein